MSKRARQFQALLDDRGLDFEVRELSDSTRTAAEAAAALGCEKAQIVKSLVFKDADSDSLVLILASGTNRVSEEAVASATGIRLAKADATFVRDKTGFSIGGVPPIGHREAATVLVDRELLQYAEVWAAAGTPHAVFGIRGPVTDILSDYRVIAIC